ncbi:MAG: response regulator [Gammaproteobacteria bacterium]
MAAHILIIEDNDMSFVLADYLLRQVGYLTARATDGPSGVQAALENVADLILCDLDLPLMDGYQVANTLRNDSTWRRVPLLAFTGDSPGNAHNEALALDAGFAGLVFKPVDARTFSATIARHVAPGLRAS